MIKTIKIKVPATTANLGPGFDCIGMALSIYNYLEIQEGTLNGESFVIFGNKRTPTDENNLIYKTIVSFYCNVGKKLPPITMRQRDYIPMARGLGSSAACVVAGLMAANALSGIGLSREELIQMGAQIEGHPDNSTPAFVGGLTVGIMTEQRLEYISIPCQSWQTLRFALMIPEFELSTEKARTILPFAYSRQDVVHNTSRTALLIAALMSGDFEKLSYALDDRIHQPYRIPLVPDMDVIFKQAKKMGAYNTYLSGAGPALIAITEDANFVERMLGFLSDLSNKWTIGWVSPDFTGATNEG
ncbi:MAG: homoserine kinase [Defluviitaleaceae bacterium]|nr:homoserine kinase [Defluviitaleaceae bacterium]